jgi:hypothetical protein
VAFAERLGWLSGKLNGYANAVERASADELEKVVERLPKLLREVAAALDELRDG